MKWAVTCCDGLPVSGLLTVFRNVVRLGVSDGLIEPRVPADLGFSWRPDKWEFFPRGGRRDYPDWLEVSDWAPGQWSRDELAARLTRTRDDVARLADLAPGQVEALRAEIEELAAPYEQHFGDWLAASDPDWVCAINMTLSDAVPATLGLHRAARRRWGQGRPGGVLFWDHDLFGSCSVYENGARVYPPAPSVLTPLPGSGPGHRWVVATDGLAAEAAGYRAAARPQVLPNLLPEPEPGPLAARHREFLAGHGIGAERPVLLAPVRVWRPKGADIAVGVLADLRARARRAGEPDPCLLIFGRLAEDPEFAADLAALARRLGVGPDVRFLDGVPLASRRDDAGGWHLDEADLLKLAAATGGAVLFTPSQPDIDTVGLGPALSAVAGVPCVVTEFDCFPEVYGERFAAITVEPTKAGLRAAAAQLHEAMRARRRGDPRAAAALAGNAAIVAERFGSGGWRELLASMAAQC
jgi:glycosyltransferase involved in cell wall biosynthesis